MKRYRYRVWCADCFSEDYQGCFNGGYDISEETFDTPQQANEAGEEAAGACGTWYHDVVGENYVSIQLTT